MARNLTALYRYLNFDQIWYNLKIVTRVDPFKPNLYLYLYFDEIEGFEDFGRVIPVAQMPKLKVGLD